MQLPFKAFNKKFYQVILKEQKKVSGDSRCSDTPVVEIIFQAGFLIDQIITNDELLVSKFSDQLMETRRCFCFRKWMW